MISDLGYILEKDPICRTRIRPEYSDPSLIETTLFGQWTIILQGQNDIVSFNDGAEQHSQTDQNYKPLGYIYQFLSRRKKQNQKNPMGTKSKLAHFSGMRLTLQKAIYQEEREQRLMYKVIEILMYMVLKSFNLRHIYLWQNDNLKECTFLKAWELCISIM